MINTVVTVVLFIVSFVVLFLNEDRTIRQHLSLNEAKKDIVSLKWFDPFQKQYVGRVIHLAGPLNTGEPLSEPDYNIQVQAVKLRRRVAMYQWIEESVDRLGHSPPEDVMDHDERQYFYHTEWKEKLIDDSHFHMRHGHQNPASFPVESKTQLAAHVRIGEYELNEDVKRSFLDFILITSDTRPDIAGVKLHSGFYYHCEDVYHPQVGDVRLQFLLAGLESTSYTIVGQLNESGIVEPFKSTVGQEIMILKRGELSIDEVLSQESFSLNVKSWTMRALGTGILFIALSKSTDILVNCRFKAAAKKLTVLRSFRWKRIRLCFSMATALLLMAIVWSLHKPLTGIGLFLGSFILYLFCLKSV